MRLTDSSARRIKCLYLPTVTAISSGSALVMCLVFLAALSAIAFSALDAVWSGHRMVSAYVSFHDDFTRSEQALLLSEQAVWQQIRTEGLQPWLDSEPEAVELAAGTVLTVHRDWLETDFSSPQCGTLFVLDVAPGADSVSGLSITAQWDICCEDREQCLASGFLQVRRYWSRH